MTALHLDAPVPELSTSPNLTDAQRKQLFLYMLHAREFDNAMLKLYRQGRAFGGVYSQLGNEATSVGTAFALNTTKDVLFPMHRNVGSHFVFGAEIKQLMLNFLAREGSQMRGTDGTGHYADPALRIYGNISHLSAMIPVASGFALASKMRGESCVALTYIGDGGCNVGEFHEAMNFASVQKIPMIVVIENNQYAYSTPSNLEYACEKLSDRALGYGCFGETVDGTDIELVYDTTLNYVQKARNGEGPALIETVTMRMRGHAEHDDFSYVPKEQLDYWAKRDPVERYEKRIIERGIMSAEEIAAFRSDLATRMFAAIDATLERPYPAPEEGYKLVFVE
ncbi:MAG: thiamine pyrophosphate-dependent dehydrogenase E1 component subunit alpha [Candidatus Kapabacteria bacterium]|nr:thiamine pyrophosphate-dependent dehydrogenase E1 component subunit alpha [Candidatus Kapabacteria bacterium]